MKVLIIGDAIIDQYDTVRPPNKPIKENILATRYVESNIYLGGVFAAASNLSQFNENITLCSVVGKDRDIKSKYLNFQKKLNQKFSRKNN